MKTLIVKRNGNIVGIVKHGPNNGTPIIPLDVFGKVSIRRASYIVPTRSIKCIWFILLRLVFGDNGRVAEWTRTWTGPWQVRWAESLKKIAFEHVSRLECERWEIQELTKRLESEQ